MSWKESWTKKAREHFEAGIILYENSLYRDSLTRIYYCAYSLMVAECGESPQGRWKHKGIIRFFFKKLHKESKIDLLTKEEIELIEDFYEERRMADYTFENIDKETVETYISLTAKFV